MLTHSKLILAGDTLHYYHYNYPIEYGEKKAPSKKTKSKLEFSPDERFISSIYRSKKAIKLLLQSNAFKYFDSVGKPLKPIFVTFTFAENVQDLKLANYQFTKFIQRFNYEVFREKRSILRYLSVVEFQQRGAVHFHTVFFNLPYTERVYDKVLDIWGNGFTFVQTVKNTSHLVAYLSKYLSKQNFDSRLVGHKAYSTSRGLNKPLTIYNPLQVESILSFAGEPSFQKQYVLNDTVTDYRCYSLVDNNFDNNNLGVIVNAHQLKNIECYEKPKQKLLELPSFQQFLLS